MEFQVRRAQCDVPSSITLDNGDLLVMDGSAQSEYAHRTVSGCQGPRVNLIFRWVTQHTSSCPPAGVAGSCVHGSAAPGSRGWGRGGVGENKWIPFWGSVLRFSILVFFLLVNTWTLCTFLGDKTTLLLQEYGLFFLCTAEYASS